MKTRKKQSNHSEFDSAPLTRSARRKLLHAIDVLISNFESEPSKAKPLTLESRNSKELDRNYQRLRNAAMVLNYWHSNSRYLSIDGACMPLARTGRQSLDSLAKDALNDEELGLLAADDIIGFGLVKKIGGKLIPNKRSAVVGQRSPLILAHATSAISRMIETISHNVSGARPPRYERQVSEVRIKENELPQFLRFAEQQGQYLIDSIDDWLSTREIPSDSAEKAVTVGVGAYAWVEPRKDFTKRKLTSKARSRR